VKIIGKIIGKIIIIVVHSGANLFREFDSQLVAEHRQTDIDITHLKFISRN
jgi:hypothetical protein